MKNNKAVKLDVVSKEFQKGYNIAKTLIPAVTMFGSARFSDNNLYYKKAQQLGYKLGNAGYSVITGGGGGIMEAGNRGAYECGKTKAVGFKITLPFEKHLNPYTHIAMDFKNFYTRKYMLINFSEAVIAFPGGFGTMDELFEVLTLLQTGKLKFFKIFLYGVEFWSPLIRFMKISLIPTGVISVEDMDRFRLTDDLDYIVKSIKG